MTSTFSLGLQITLNLLIEKIRRVGHGFRNYRIRILLAASGTRADRRAVAHG